MEPYLSPIFLLIQIQLMRLLVGSLVRLLSPIFLRIQIQLMLLLVELLVGQLLPSFYIVWYDLPTNSPTNYPTDKCISWILMLKKKRL